MNILLVGLGRWGEKHLRVLRELGAGVWVADVSPARLAWAVTQGVDGQRAVADYRAALPHVDAVDIVTPADSHWAVAGATTIASAAWATMMCPIRWSGINASTSASTAWRLTASSARGATKRVADGVRRQTTSAPSATSARTISGAL